ncbi:MAG: MFS transporter [Bdellovibrionaceae bacterium]|nr:MFS transporter [Pseudobdellovibrionaceae bacterium]
MKDIFNRTVVVAALGYFVDMFDITLFGVVRVASLQSIGITDPAQILEKGVLLYNLQMIGMLLGGIVWGILGDKRGRLSVLYGSILLYSLANLGNAFVTDLTSYAVLRFIAGVGLAGELGAAITLVSETMSKEKRGYGTTVVATLGLCGSVAAALVGKYMSWQTAYFVGGGLGLLLLVSRIRVFESGMFEGLKTSSHARMGDVRLLLSGARPWRYLACILAGVPIYFITSILMTFAPEITAGLGVQGTVTAADALLYGSIGLALGDLATGVLSQKLRSRKKAVALALSTAALLMMIYVSLDGMSMTTFHLLCFGLGLCAGYWAVLVTMAAEQFGTNIRSTVATTVPNFVRGSAVLITISFSTLKGPFGVVNAGLIVGAAVFTLALTALYFMRETYGRELNYLEGVDEDSSTEASSEPLLAVKPSNVSTTG